MEVWILILAGALLINTGYWCFLWIGLRCVPQSSDQNTNGESARIIIVGRNAIQGLKSNISGWRSQFEGTPKITIVDDDSNDESRNWLREQSDIETLWFKKSSPGKKAALAHALDHVSDPYILLTDADGVPASPYWMRKSVAAVQEQNKDILLLYGPFFRTKGWLDRAVRFENVLTALQYFGWWTRGKPYMGVGRNLLYHERAYRQFISQEWSSELASGDDDLFLQKIANADNTGACIDPDTFVYSQPPASWKEWFRQKSRHISTSYEYDTATKLILGFFALSQMMVTLAVFTQFVHFIPFLALLIGIRWTVFIILGKQSLSLLKQEDLLPYLPILDAFLGGYFILLWVYSFFQPKNQW